MNREPTEREKQIAREAADDIRNRMFREEFSITDIILAAIQLATQRPEELHALRRCDMDADRGVQPAAKEVDYFTSRNGKLIAKDEDDFDVDAATGTADDFHPLVAAAKQEGAPATEQDYPGVVLSKATIDMETGEIVEDAAPSPAQEKPEKIAKLAKTMAQTAWDELRQNVVALSKGDWNIYQRFDNGRDIIWEQMLRALAAAAEEKK